MTPSFVTAAHPSQVPQRSPFRYPGGKSWLIPIARQWLASQPTRPKMLVEPFAGGASIGLTALVEDLVDSVYLIEKDADIAAVWLTIKFGNSAKLVELIRYFECTPANVAHVVSTEPTSTLERAFRAIVKNRTFYGGITTGESRALVLGGRGLGVASRWYPATLARRIEAIDQERGRLFVDRLDSLPILPQYGFDPRIVFFIDPPYTGAGTGRAKGRRLYWEHALDHAELFTVASALAGDFLMTYDRSSEIEDLAREHGFDTRLVRMRDTKATLKFELLIGRDLSWLDAAPASLAVAA